LNFNCFPHGIFRTMMLEEVRAAAARHDSRESKTILTERRRRIFNRPF